MKRGTPPPVSEYESWQLKQRPSSALNLGAAALLEQIEDGAQLRIERRDLDAARPARSRHRRRR